jgi:hypothetical protein
MDDVPPPPPFEMNPLSDMPPPSDVTLPHDVPPRPDVSSPPDAAAHSNAEADAIAMVRALLPCCHDSGFAARCAEADLNPCIL